MTELFDTLSLIDDENNGTLLIDQKGEEDSEFLVYAEEEDNWPLDYDECSYNDTLQDDEDDGGNPAEDLADLKEAYENILEHVVGDRQSDPDDIRVRAYVVVRKVLVVMDDTLTPLWEDEAVNETTGEDADDETTLVEDVGLLEKVLETDGNDTDDIQVLEEAGSSANGTDEVMGERVMLGGWNTTFNVSSPRVREAEVSRMTEETVVEGARVRLVCNVTGVPHYWVEWRREANLTFPDGSIMMGGQSVLLEYVGREDAGIYVCTARNSLGRTHSTALTIHVHYPPVVGVWARDVGVSDVELGCLVEGRPRPSLAWYRNNTRLSPPSCHGNVELHSSVLSPAFLLAIVRVSNTSEADFAYYHCRATNSVGISRAYVMLHDDSGGMSLDKLKPKVVTKYRAVENPRLASFLVGMVPPLYIALYIIAYLGCYKTSLTGGGGHGRFGTSMDLDQ
ncbi:hemicentin-1-like [Homarus americanus]|uniref:hemicentin-1-like n=1 Tax=Homarus americanus TaxID=6706 RepID=UPI001C440D4F|nr:hemicentin-1-like [Homarus americanus]